MEVDELLADSFNYCSVNEKLTAALRRRCEEVAIVDDKELHREPRKLAEIFLTLKRRRIISATNVDFLKQVAEAGEDFHLKERINQFEKGKPWLPDRVLTGSMRSTKWFSWPVDVHYGSNALCQVLLSLMREGANVNERHKEALYIFCDGHFKPSIDFSRYVDNPFQLMETLVRKENISPRNLSLLKGFFSLETVRNPEAVAILECFEAISSIQELLARLCDLQSNSFGRNFGCDELFCRRWLKLCRSIQRLLRISFKGTNRLQHIKSFLRYFQEIEPGGSRLNKLLNHLIEKSCMADKEKQWQPILKLLVVSTESCRLAKSPLFETADESKLIGSSPVGPKILRQMDEFYTFLQEKEAAITSGAFHTRTEETQEMETVLQNYIQGKDQDEYDDIEMLNIFFKGIVPFH
ncbi:uncharacterized protein LOC111333686 [Stylophora pistillata]|uniref:uncharacterized protein LOC111333686 n=1 Tax=Stylophora pistillata TaxID=50429 RepID=UPI000C054318|nr:uncharacterized protein LOC111333686 [Stylophora pistillata]